MAVQVQELIDRIKAEGVGAAQAEASRIIGAAKAEAASIAEKAKNEAKALVEAAAADAVRETASGRAALAQASRDALLLLKKEIENLVEAIVLKESKAALSSEALKDIVPLVFKSFKDLDAGKSVIQLPEADAAKLTEHFRAVLAAEIKAGLEIKPHPRLKAGFRIAAKDGGAYYDYSAESLAEIVSQHLNPALAEIMKSQVKGS